MATHNGRMFSTYDSDNDLAGNNCAYERGGGWWWKKCGPAAVTACMGGGAYSYAWKKLPQINKNLNTTLAWDMCP